MSSVEILHQHNGRISLAWPSLLRMTKTAQWHMTNSCPTSTFVRWVHLCDEVQAETYSSSPSLHRWRCESLTCASSINWPTGVVFPIDNSEWYPWTKSIILTRIKMLYQINKSKLLCWYPHFGTRICKVVSWNQSWSSCPVCRIKLTYSNCICITCFTRITRATMTRFFTWEQEFRLALISPVHFLQVWNMP